MILKRMRSVWDRVTRVDINDNWAIIEKNFSDLRSYINILAGNQEVDELIQRIETAIANAINATEDTSEALQEIEEALDGLNSILAEARSVITIGQSVISDMAVLENSIIALRDELITLKNELSNIVQSESQRVTAEQSRVQNESQRVTAEQSRVQNENQRVTAEQSRVTAENSRNTIFNNKISEADEHIEDMSLLIDNFKSFDYSPNQQYVFPNIVKYGGSSFIVLKPTLGVTPVDDGVNYRLVALKGLDGTGAVSTVNSIGPDENGNVLIPNVTTSIDGLMSKEDKVKLSGISEGANFVQLNNTLTSISTSEAATANTVKVLNDKKADSTDLITLDDKVTQHLVQTTYQKFVGALKSLDYTCSVYADGSTTDRPDENASWCVDVMVRPELKDSFRTLIAYRATGTQLEIKYLKMVNGVWGDWIDYTSELRNLIAAKYTKPSSGIPQTDLTSALQTTLSNLKSAANQDYEEGLWTPTLIGSSGGSATLPIAHGQYRRIGKLVTISFVIQKDVATTLVGDVRIGGLPFISNYAGGNLAIGFVRGITRTSGLLTGETTDAGNYITLSKCNDDGTWQSLQNADVNVTMRMRATMTYLIN